ncbi:phosphatidylserine decarboxylase [Chryseobacterium pennipullorum]|uniref:Phosphatidylserine decarboxylase n=1 Tax=Chryseobacterium pennipullorum TaxID=2258963 RepID=A0A3D9B2F7_9FLAO|nr:phosphatidylserine decarboxylase [Chryseobacterium pennipullorum]REC47528.1 phosphatidylserine decarboxylase [Chryseobacterium pennipullorum]
MEIKYIVRKTGQIQREVPPAERMLKFLYHHPFGKTAILPLVKQKIVSDWYGRKMYKKSSVKRIKSFVDTLKIDLSESEKNMGDFSSFNDFIFRKLKTGARTIEDGLVSPGDGKIIAFENVADVHEFYVKGQRFTLEGFLRNKELARSFENSSIFILRLAPNDYHRFHFPYNGIPSEPVKIKGHYLSVSPYALIKDFGRVFCENKREYTILSTDQKGKILISAVGATMFGSIINTFKPYTEISKGQEMGYFAFGGSTIVMLIEKGHITIDRDIIENTKKGFETYVKMGERIAF